MLIRLNLNSGTTVHQQIVEQISRMAAAGTVAPGERLPTVRELAQELVVNPNTVAKAYQELERLGVVEARRGMGTFVSEPSEKIGTDERLRRAEQAVAVTVAEMRHLGISRDDAERIAAKQIELQYALDDRAEADGELVSHNSRRDK